MPVGVGIDTRRRAVLGLATSLVLASVGPLCRAAPGDVPRLGDLQARAWTTADGLPQNGILSLAQTAEGFVWIGTQEGLARFDGVDFRIFDRSTLSLLEDQFISALLAAPERVLWVGTREGLVRIAPGHVERLGREAGLPSEYVRSLATAPDGALWVGTYGAGLARLAGSEVRVVDERHGLPDPFVRAVAVTADGVVWAGTSRGLARIDGDGASVVAAPGGPGRGLVRSLAVDSRQRLWVGTEGDGLYRFDGESFERLAADSVTTVSALAVGPGGAVWLAAEPDQLLRIDRDDTVESARKTPATALLVDAEGSVWLGGNQGLVQLKRARVGMIPAGEELSVRTVHEGRSGRLWVGADGGGVHELVDGVLRRPGHLSTIAAASVRSIVEDGRGDTWIGAREGLFRVDDRGLRRFGADDGLPEAPVNVLASSPSGDLWVGTAAGAVLWDGSRFTPPGGSMSAALETARLRALVVDADGARWAGTEEGLLARAENGRRFDRRDGLASDFILSLHENESGDLWIGTTAGLSLWRDTTIVSFTAAQGVPQRAVFQILEDDSENLWLCTSRGVYRLSVAELLAVAAGRLRAVHPLGLTEEDGLATSQCNGGTQPAGSRTADGRLLLPTQRGLAVIDPSAIGRRGLPPRVVIDTVRIANRPVTPLGALELGPEKPSLEITYTAPTFLSPRSLAFRYWVEGLHEDWVYAGSRRQVIFAGLEPGSYRFRVAAASEEGIWDEDGASLDFAVRPSLFERGEMRVAAVLVLAAVLGGLYAFRMQQVRRRQRLLESLVEERTEQLREANEVLAGLAATDALTGITNYRRFQELLQQEWRRGIRHGRHLSLVLLDIDHFKGFNDTYGHAEGDSCLRRVAQALERLASREGDVLARYGGEEFAALLPETGEESAVLMAERFRHAVEALEIPNTSSVASEVVTLSAGVATIAPSRDLEPSVLFELADDALYDAKRSGRNRVARRRLDELQGESSDREDGE